MSSNSASSPYSSDEDGHYGDLRSDQDIRVGREEETSMPRTNVIECETDRPSAVPISPAVTSTPKVRFSLDATNDARPFPTSATPTRAATWNFGKPTSPVGVLRSSGSPSTRPSPLSPTSPNQTQLRMRNRGYSLRRSIFSQNIERSNNEHGLAIELGSPTSEDTDGIPQAQSSLSEKLSPTTITVHEEDLVEAEIPSKPVRLSDPAIDLPLYSKWIQNQRSPIARRIKRLSRAYRRLRDRILQGPAIPPSADGRHVRVNLDASFLTIDERTNSPYVNNVIRSSRYTAFNFVPRQLWAQFGKLANFYFLCVSLLQMVPGLSTTGTYTTIIPLLIFVGISMAKEAYDDIRRRRLDREENDRQALVLSYHSASTATREYTEDGEGLDSLDLARDAWRSQHWQELRVGDVVLLERNASVPADVVLLHSSDPTDVAYIETKSLDGETNLKSKRPVSAVAQLCRNETDAARLEAEFVVEDPNLDLYKFEGRVTARGETFPLTNNEVVYRGSILRNTHHAFGLVIYTGEECKIRMNANKNARVKAPALQAKVNRVVVIVACIVFFMSIIMTIANQIWVEDVEDHAWYLHSASVPFGHILTSFIIMFNTMLPLSLYVSLEIVKLAQIYFMNDIDMYDAETDTPMEARTSTINEELGQVSYIFSDKTGTLTNNSMKFRKLSIAGTAWLHDVDFQEHLNQGGQKLLHKKRSKKGKAKSRKSYGQVAQLSQKPSFASADEWQPPTKIGVSLQCGKTEEMLEYIQHRPYSIFARKARFFILGLALCHTCVPEKDDEGNVGFQAESPDELALVTAAQELGYIVSDRQSNTITIKTYPNGAYQPAQYDTYEVLDVIEFTSARKRMSIIVRLPDSRICLFTKGADTTIRKLLRLREIAEVQAAHVDRRASLRKSMEVQEVLRRKSSQFKGESVRSGRKSVGASPIEPLVGRKSSVSLSKGMSVHGSIDAWLKDREHDVGVSMSRRSASFYSPRANAQPATSLPMSPPEQLRRFSLRSIETPRSSFQSDDMEVEIDESLVLNDKAVFERCFQHIDDFATEGLRTLLYGYKYLPEDEYRKWKAKYNDASTSLVDRQSRIDEASSLIESQLDLLGATAIEDKLQDGVPDAIDRFRRAGIKMWMLTGDKRETAINIGHSCRLIKDYSTTIVLDHTLGDLPSRMATAVAEVHDSLAMAHSVLVVDGQTLNFIDTDPALKILFTDLAIAADSVICCRASPSQKAGLVRTIRHKVKGSVTLAIGDGANDIAMIQEAHVGIGIAGKEGLQAARTSDYSIAQFRFLLKLLLVHGRWNYVRVCKYTLGTFWKEMVFYLVQALYQRWTGYTGTSLYEPWSLSMFNTLFTSLPVIFMGVFEKDLSAPTLLAVPELYAVGRLNRGFNIPTYLWWATLGTFEAVVVYFMIWGIYGDSYFTHDQQLFAMGSLAFTATVTFISIKLQFIELHNKTIMAGLAVFLSIGGWWLWNLLLAALYPTSNTTYTVNKALLYRFGRNGLWWFLLIIIVLALFILEIMIKSIKLITFPSDAEVFQMYERDLDIRKRFEESAADLLQQGWHRGTKKSSLEILREEELVAERERQEAEREAEIEAILNRPRTMDAEEVPSEMIVRRRSSIPVPKDEMSIRSVHFEDSDGKQHTPKRSIDIGDLFRSGFGKVKHGNME